MISDALLRTAAVLVPEPRRAEWILEWRAELWHVRRESGTSRVTAFCLGAFKDAFWLWREDPDPDRYSPFAQSPARCLVWLAALGAICASLALFLPAARAVLLGSLYPRNLVALPVSRGQVDTVAFYVPVRLKVDTPGGPQTLFVGRTTADLLRLLDIPLERTNSGKPSLVLTSAALRKYRDGPVSARRYTVVGIFPAYRWHLSGVVDGWLIEDKTAFEALPADTSGFAVGRSGGFPADGHLHAVRIPDLSLELLAIVPPIFLFACVLLALMRATWSGGCLLRIGPRRGLFLAAKTLLILPIVAFGSLDLGSLGGTVSPLFFDVALFGSLIAARWTFADQRRRCPVCLRLLGSPVRIGEPSLMFLEWRGTEQVCLRGHGLLYVPEWPAIWPGRQRWMELGSSWAGLFRIP